MSGPDRGVIQQPGVGAVSGLLPRGANREDAIVFLELGELVVVLIDIDLDAGAPVILRRRRNDVRIGNVEQQIEQRSVPERANRGGNLAISCWGVLARIHANRNIGRRRASPCIFSVAVHLDWQRREDCVQEFGLGKCGTCRERRTE